MRHEFVDVGEKPRGPLVLSTLRQGSRQSEKGSFVRAGGPFYEIRRRVSLLCAIGPVSHGEKCESKLRIVRISFAGAREMFRRLRKIARVAIEGAQIVVGLHMR